ncbi:hypothetical protein T11_5964 [Trichinella zimbabwensis]|uniref:Uncharacterized protein n=1 Tax=Trichinella zimbabwensis TaxID=268475 RepID=A0A0V1HIE5_9BILA|nr:hypothetical protein T11_5964 [Trichinella zimbabwensis]
MYTHTHKVYLQPRHVGSTGRSTFIQHNNSNLVNSRQARPGVAIAHGRAPQLPPPLNSVDNATTIKLTYFVTIHQSIITDLIDCLQIGCYF